MTRTERIQKLARAIKRYRGSRDIERKKWITPPIPALVARIREHLAILKLNVPESMAAIDGFKTRPEFERWISAI